MRSSTRAAIAAGAETASREGRESPLIHAPVQVKEEAVDLSPHRTLAGVIEDERSSSSSSSIRSKRKRIAQDKIDAETETASKRTVTKSRKKTTTSTSISRTAKIINHSPPSDWEDLYNRVKDMRMRNPTAPVDVIGCTRLFVKESSPRDRRFHILVSLMLSAQTKDETTAAAMKRLHLELGEGLSTTVKGEEEKKEEEPKEEVKDELETSLIKQEKQEKETSLIPSAPGSDRFITLPKTSSLTLENVLAVPASRLDELIRQVNFHNNKTKYIKATAVMLRDVFNSDIPSTPEDLMRLPGVGPKMAYLAMSAAWGKVMGIGVDVHVHRITNLWGWVKTKTPEETRLALESWLPREKWGEINKMLVGVGQTIKDPAKMKDMKWWDEYYRNEKLKEEEEIKDVKVKIENAN